MSEKREILLVDDERTLLTTLAARLESAGYVVRTAADGEAALNLYRARRPDLVLTDVMMPRLDGMALLKAIRATDDATPIIFLTAYAAEADELKSLQLGADDYLEKTLSDSLLLARIAATLRRARPSAADAEEGFAFAAWRVCPKGFSMRGESGATVALTDRELALLKVFAAHPGEALSRAFLLDRIWGRGADVADGSLSVAIRALREKLGASASALATVHGLGYVYRP